MTRIIYLIVSVLTCFSCSNKTEKKANIYHGDFGIYYSTQLNYDSITNEVIVNGKPIIELYDIISFDSLKNTYKLTKSGIDKLDSLDVPLKGLSMTIAIGKKPIYSFGLFRIESSYCCPEYKIASFYSGIDEIKIETGNNFCKNIFPRFPFQDSRIINEYFEKIKIKN